MNTKKIVLTAVLAVMVAAVPAAASDMWLHVKVNEAGGDNANVVVNLPLSIVESALPMIPEEQIRDGKIVIDDAEFDAIRLRELWAEVQNSPDMTFVTVQSDDANVRVYKENGYLIARTTEGAADGAQVHARLPLSVVDALLSGEGNELNIRAALDALIAHGEGELVAVADGETTVRVWIDNYPEAD